MFVYTYVHNSHTYLHTYTVPGTVSRHQDTKGQQTGFCMSFIDTSQLDYKRLCYLKKSKIAFPQFKVYMRDCHIAA